MMDISSIKDLKSFILNVQKPSVVENTEENMKLKYKIFVRLAKLWKSSSFLHDFICEFHLEFSMTNTCSNIFADFFWIEIVVDQIVNDTWQLSS